MRKFGLHRHLSSQKLTELLDGRLSGRQEADALRTVAACRHCQEELDSLRTAKSLLQELPQLAPPRNFTLTTAPTFNPAVERQPRRRWPTRAPAWAYAGAASLAGLAIVIGVLVGSRLTFLDWQNSSPETSMAAIQEEAKEAEQADTAFYRGAQPEAAPELPAFTTAPPALTEYAEGDNAAPETASPLAGAGQAAADESPVEPEQAARSISAREAQQTADQASTAVELTRWPAVEETAASEYSEIAPKAQEAAPGSAVTLMATPVDDAPDLPGQSDAGVEPSGKTAQDAQLTPDVPDTRLPTENARGWLWVGLVIAFAALLSGIVLLAIRLKRRR